MNLTVQIEPRLQTNLDTDFLKMIAVLSMIMDHIGSAFFPDIILFRIIGRLAFPLFCYCMTVGLLHTHNIKRYLLRIGIFAAVSQPFYILAFHPHAFLENFTNWNIFFTLFLSLIAMWGWKEKKYWLFALALFVISWWNFDYSNQGIVLMLIFYCCRNRPVLGASLYGLFWAPCLFGAVAGSPMTLTVAGYTMQISAFAVLTLPLIYCHTHTAFKINRYFFYAVYPLHLAAIAIIRLALNL